MRGILKTAKWIGIGLAFVIFAYIIFAWFWFTRVLGEPHPRPARAHAAAKGAVLKLNRAAGRAVKIRVIQTGTTRVPFGQFYYGTRGWIGIRGIFKMGSAGAGETFRAPVHVYIIEHPTRGLVMVDAGLSPEQTRAGYYSVSQGGMDARAFTHEENHVPPSMTLTAGLRRLKLKPGDIKHVIITHLHEDHLGELRRYRHAKVHISKREWEDRGRLSYEPSYGMIKNWSPFEFDSGRFHSFAAAKDLFGDSTIILLPAFGHTAGHTAVLVNAGDYQAYITGDSIYTMRHLDPERLASFNQFGETGLKTYRDTIHRVLKMQKTLGDDFIILPEHDPYAYTKDYIRPFLADGRLSRTERRRMRAYQSALYYADGRIRPEAVPRRIVGTDGKGRVDLKIK